MYRQSLCFQARDLATLSFLISPALIIESRSLTIFKAKIGGGGGGD